MNRHLDNYLSAFHEGVQKQAFDISLSPEHYLALAGALGGGGLGALLDRGNRWRGGLIGSGAGGLAGFGAGRALDDVLPTFNRRLLDLTPEELADWEPMDVYGRLTEKHKAHPQLGITIKYKDLPDDFKRFVDARNARFLGENVKKVWDPEQSWTINPDGMWETHELE